MIKRNLHIAAILSIVLLAMACNKSQVRTNRIDGTWDVTRVETVSADGTSSVSTDPDGSFTFDKCNIADDDYCNYTQQTSYTIGSTVFTTNASGLYRFDDEGKTLVIREGNEDGTYDETRYTVLSFKRKKLELQDTADDGARTLYTLEKN